MKFLSRIFFIASIFFTSFNFASAATSNIVNLVFTTTQRSVLPSSVSDDITVQTQNSPPRLCPYAKRGTSPSNFEKEVPRSLHGKNIPGDLNIFIWKCPLENKKVEL